MNLYERFVARYGRLPTEFDPDYLEMLQMTKYRILEVPDVNPAKCANCGSSKGDGRKYVDFGLQVDWHGCVFLCGLCVKDIARALGLFDELETRLNGILEEAVTSRDLLEQGERLRDQFVQTFAEFKDFYGNLPTPDVNSDSDSSPSVESYESPTGAPTIDGDEPDVIKPKSRTTKPATSTGRENVSSLAELLNANSK